VETEQLVSAQTSWMTYLADIPQILPSRTRDVQPPTSFLLAFLQGGRSFFAERAQTR
jgi:hypothetical protein